MDADRFAHIAAGLAHPARAAMVQILMDGRQHTASDLAAEADLLPQTASGHLRALEKAGLVSARKQGRHRVFTLPGPEVAGVVEALSVFAGPPRPRLAREPRPIEIARVCYDHLAGRLGVGLTELLSERGYLQEEGRRFRLSPQGKEWFSRLGVDVEAAARQRRAFALSCLDWTERRPHLAGALGAALLRRLVERGWCRRLERTRVLEISGEGWRALHESLGINREFPPPRAGALALSARIQRRPARVAGDEFGARRT